VPQSPANKEYQAGFMAALMLKDLNLSQEASAAANVDTPMGALAKSLYTQYADAGFSEKDFSGIIQFLKDKKS
jgi:3-hydroxyisobutyrate dehydrogenase